MNLLEGGCYVRCELHGHLDYRLLGISSEIC